MTSKIEATTGSFTPGSYWTPERAKRSVDAMLATLASPAMQAEMEQTGDDFSETHVHGLQQPSRSPSLTREGVAFRRGRQDDVPELTRLIVEADLPALFIEEFVEGFAIADKGGQILAAGGLEVYEGGAGVIRSIAVARAARGLGLGREIAELLMADAGASGMSDVFLFTQDAYLFWNHMGYVDVPMDAWPLPARACWQYRYVVAHGEMMARIGVHSMWKPL